MKTEYQDESLIKSVPWQASSIKLSACCGSWQPASRLQRLTRCALRVGWLNAILSDSFSCAHCDWTESLLKTRAAP